MLELEAAREQILLAIERLPAERIPLVAASGRILSQSLRSPIDLPPFDNSAMDGYAVRAEDVTTASPEEPVSLRLLGQVAAGEVYAGAVESGTCVRVFTGSPLTAGADAVVMQEDTRLAAQTPEVVLILDRARPWENVRLRGEDLKRNALVVTAGEKVTPGRAGVLAALGFAEVSVACRPVVGLLATGSELIEPGQPLVSGQIFESNRASLSLLVAQAGAVPKIFPLVRDSLPATEAALRRAFEECDGVITSGGVSVGELDFVKAALEQIGGTMQFWRVAIKPGKPFVFGRWRDKFLFGLPGNPVSAFVTFLLLVRPALLRWQGATEVGLPAHRCVLAEPLANPSDRRHFMRVHVNGRGEARSAGGQASHILNALAQANGLIDVPPQSALAAGAMVDVLRIVD